MPRCFAGGPPHLECQDSVWMRERVTARLRATNTTRNLSQLRAAVWPYPGQSRCLLVGCLDPQVPKILRSCDARHSATTMELSTIARSACVNYEFPNYQFFLRCYGTNSARHPERYR